MKQVMMMNHRQQVINHVQVGDRFFHVLQEWLSPLELRKVRERNAHESNDGICHSHDYCDANEAMGAAFDYYNLPWATDEHQDEWMSLWNAAWEYAKAKHLGGKHERA